MTKIEDLILAINSKRELFWNDPEPIKGNDYKISWIENINLNLDELDPILIQYNNGGSEAQVFLHEIIIK